MSKPKDRRSNWQWTKLAKQRITIAATNQEPCCRCGQPINYQLDGRNRDGPTADHLHPLAHGGQLTPPLEFLAPAHRHCNARHGATIGNKQRKQQQQNKKEKEKRDGKEIRLRDRGLPDGGRRSPCGGLS
jgi:5-methylcytosine-specific restriction endonuclease McrA